MTCTAVRFIIINMVLPTRRSAGKQQVTMSNDTEESEKRTAGAFPGTPHPQKRMRLEQDDDVTPPTEESANPADDNAPSATGYDEVS